MLAENVIRPMGALFEVANGFGILIRHVQYIHYNPVRHNLVSVPITWAYSSFKRHVQAGVYPADWGAEGPVSFPDGVGHE